MMTAELFSNMLEARSLLSSLVEGRKGSRRECGEAAPRASGDYSTKPSVHRWHHTAAARGREKNFASTFPSIDLAFGTFSMPQNELPDAYGIADRSFPPSFGAQMLYPFKQ
jgi:sterol desaturase/sphingolipid hydroxylase (fatty acid hydroxylase superfamily)